MRLPRPPIPFAVKLRVLCRQIAQVSRQPLNIEQVVKVAIEQRSLTTFVEDRLGELAMLLGCFPEQLHLDHDPALVNREKLIEIDIGRPKRIRAIVVPKGGKVIRYFPDANDPDHLYYRVGGIGSDHDIKTRVRGDHGQHSDLALARKNRRIAKKQAERNRPKPHRPSKKAKFRRWPSGRKIQNRPFQGRT